MSWRLPFLLPKLVRHALRAPKDPNVAWERYWRDIQRTGPGGQVLWDGASAAERDWIVGLVRRHLDPRQPIVDVGCGNGRYTRVLAPMFPRVVGVDCSSQAIERARGEAAACGEGQPAHVSFRTLDMTEPGAGERLRSELGAAHVFVRGVFHVLTPAKRHALRDNCRVLLGDAGMLVLVETDFPGSALSYLDFLGARGSDYPEPLLRCLEAGLPPPTRFGASELGRYFPRSEWVDVEAGANHLHSVAMRPGDAPRSIPAYYAVLKRSTQEPVT